MYIGLNKYNKKPTNSGDDDQSRDCMSSYSQVTIHMSRVRDP